MTIAERNVTFCYGASCGFSVYSFLLTVIFNLQDYPKPLAVMY